MSKKLSIEQILEIVKLGLSKESFDTHGIEKATVVKGVKLLNSDTIVCEFIPYSKDSVGIKTEIGFIMSFMESFFRDNPLTPEITNFAVRSFNEKNEELLYAISSKSAARFIADGQPIEWLKNTIFEDNSEDHRLHQAKRKISAIEIGLREVICEILGEKDSSWWEIYVRKKIRLNAQKFHENQKGINTNDGRKLVEFTYLLQLKTIVCDNWVDFSNVFYDKAEFKKNIDSLNEIRRDEAHNRPITHKAINDLNEIYNDIIGFISNRFPDIVPSYLIDNWKIKVGSIIEEYSNAAEYLKEDSKYNIEEMLIKIKDLIVNLKNVEEKINSVPIPPGKSEVHQELTQIIQEMRNSFEHMELSARNGDIDSFEKAHQDNIAANNKVKAFTQKILMTG